MEAPVTYLYINYLQYLSRYDVGCFLIIVSFLFMRMGTTGACGTHIRWDSKICKQQSIVVQCGKGTDFSSLAHKAEEKIAFTTVQGKWYIHTIITFHL